MRTLLCLLRKEFILFVNDKMMPRMALAFPMMSILIMPLVTTMDVRHVGVGVVDHDGGTTARAIAADLAASDYFSVTPFAFYDDALEAVEKGSVDVVLEIAPDSRLDPLGARPHISANGVNGVKGSLGAQYVAASAMKTIMTRNGIEAESPVSVSYLYNPTLDYRMYMIPALMIMLLIMICGFMAALNLVGEKESGTIEQINVTPVRPFIFVLSKLIPYWIIGVVVLLIAMAIAAIVYGLVPAGSIAVILLATILFILFMSGIGVTVANFSQTMSQAMFVMFFIVLLFIMMSGLLTPVSSMPAWAEMITYFLPPRYFIDIMRSVYLKGTTAAQLVIPFCALAVGALLANIAAAFTYRKQS